MTAPQLVTVKLPGKRGPNRHARVREDNSAKLEGYSESLMEFREFCAARGLGFAAEMMRLVKERMRG